MWAARIVVAVAIAGLFLGSISTTNPPGFFHDESDVAFNAATIEQSARDERGARMPLYFSSFGDYKSAPYVYLLAGVFAVTGPSKLAARALSATLGLLAVAVLGFIGFRLTGRTSIGVAAVALAAATPWLFEVSKLVFEVALEPLLISMLILVLAGGRAQPSWSIGRCAALGVLLALIAYAYAGGRALAPLLALSLLVFVNRERRRSIALAWVGFLVALTPMAVYAIRHPHALFARYDEISATKNKSFVSAAGTLALNFLHAASPWQWAIYGDRNPRHHIQHSGGSLLVVGLILAAIGAVVVFKRAGWDPFWAYVVLGCLASVVPHALTGPHPHVLQTIGLPVFVTTLAIPGLDFLRARTRDHRWRVVAAMLAVGGVAQFALFQTEYWHHGPRRLAAFDAQFPAVFHRALASRRPVMLIRADYAAFEDGEWYALLWRAPVRVIENGRQPVPGSVVVTTDTELCPTCPTVAEAGIFRAVVVEG